MKEKLPARPIVLLDLDDTILDFHTAEAKALRRALTELGADAGEETIKRYSEINRAHWEMLERGELTRRQVLIGRFAALFQEKGIDIPPELAQEKYEKYLSEGHYFIPGAEALLESLQETCRLFIVSNGNAAVQAGRLKSAGIAKYFEKIFISETVGFDKPSRDFFAACFDEIPDFSKEKAMMIGDSLSSDILGGINAGVRTCWFNPEGKAGREEIRPDYEIRELKEVPAVIQKAFYK